MNASETATRVAQNTTDTATKLAQRVGIDTHQSKPEHERHSEGPVARGIEEFTAQIPSDVYLWAAGASIIGSLSLMVSGNRHGALFVGQWAAPFLLLGVYNKIVKVSGSDRTDKNSRAFGQA